MQFSWNEKKRQRNVRVHGLDFVDCMRVVGGPTPTCEDDRLRYPELRYVTFGLLEDIVYPSSTPNPRRTCASSLVSKSHQT